MNICRLFIILALCTGCVLLSTGCASTNPTVNTWHNSNFSPTHTNTITLKSNLDAPPWEVETTRLLSDELQHQGFKLVPEEQSDYLLCCVISDNLVEHTLYNPIIGAPTATLPVAAPPMQPPTVPEPVQTPPIVVYNVRKSYTVPTRDIRLFLYSNPKTNPGGLQLVWQGTVTLTKKMDDTRERDLIRTLLHYFGTDQNGPVHLVQ